MSKYLDRILKKKVELTLQMGDGPNEDAFLRLQEVTYRIGVFEDLQSLYRAAKMMAYTNPRKHYEMFDSFVTMLLTERVSKLGKPLDDTRCETAYKSLNTVVRDYRQRYADNRFPKTPCDYIDRMSETMNAFLSAWLSFRNTIINL